MGLQAGFRKSEWCQDHGMTDPWAPQKNHLKAPNNQTMAFCLGDVWVQNAAGKHFVGANILKTPKSSLRSTWLKWKTQKNKQHGEEKLFTSSVDDDRIGHSVAGDSSAVNSRSHDIQVNGAKALDVVPDHKGRTSI